MQSMRAVPLPPEAQHVAIFDTSFHQTLPREAYLYGLPHVLYRLEARSWREAAPDEPPVRVA